MYVLIVQLDIGNGPCTKVALFISRVRKRQHHQLLYSRVRAEGTTQRVNPIEGGFVMKLLNKQPFSTKPAASGDPMYVVSCGI
jgi:hypothetical protein